MRDEVIAATLRPGELLFAHENFVHLLSGEVADVSEHEPQPVAVLQVYDVIRRRLRMEKIEAYVLLLRLVARQNRIVIDSGVPNSPINKRLVRRCPRDPAPPRMRMDRPSRDRGRRSVDVLGRKGRLVHGIVGKRMEIGL